MTYTVLGVFENYQDAENAIKKLQANSYNSEDISILLKDMREGQQVGRHTGVRVDGGLMSGIAAGVVVGGIAGLVAGLAIPGLGAFFIGGPIASTFGLTGVAASTISGAATGLVAGGIVGILIGFGLSQRDARVYEERISEGAMLVAIPARDSEESKVEEILRDTHAGTIKSVVPSEETRRWEIRQLDGQYQQPAYSYAGAKGGHAKKTTRHSNVGKGEKK